MHILKKLKIKKQNSLRWQIFSYFLGMIAFLLIMAWLVQAFFSEELYINYKIRQVETAATEIIENIDNEDILSLLDRVSQSQEICITLLNVNTVISNQDDRSFLYMADINENCLIHNISFIDLGRYYAQAYENGGSFREFANNNPPPVGNYDPEQFPDRNKNDMTPYRTMILANIFYNDAGEEMFLLLDSTITPLAATSGALRSQLLMYSLLMITLALVASYLSARRLSIPLRKINATAQQFAKGNFDVRFDGNGSEETEALANTLNYAAAEIARTERLQRELIANISHDLRTPLTMIGGYAEAMRDLPSENTPENAQIIIDEVKRLSGLVNEVLDLSKLQAGVTELNCEERNLSELVDHIVDNYQKMMAEQDYQISFEYDSEAWVMIDTAKIEQVIYNFLNNAVNYGGDSKQIIVRQRLIANRVRLEIQDFGQGIAKERLQDIWQRYYRTEEAHLRSKYGSGLGLSIVRSILDLHKAAYGVESQLGVGSTFWFELELCAEE